MEHLSSGMAAKANMNVWMYILKEALQSKEINKNFGSISSNKTISLNIDKIKTKYGFLTNNLSQKLAYNKIQLLKSKYFKSNNNINYNSYFIILIILTSFQ